MEIIRAAAEASALGDRGLFIAALILLGVFAIVVMKYFVRQYERLTEEHAKARDSYQQSLKEIVAESHKISRELAIVLTQNSVALDANTECTERCIDELKDCRELRERHK